jgi:hypothetical protein
MGQKGQAYTISKGRLFEIGHVEDGEIDGMLILRLNLYKLVWG